jgi:hypothetical protein
MESSHPPIPIDQQSLVALKFLSSPGPIFEEPTFDEQSLTLTNAIKNAIAAIVPFHPALEAYANPPRDDEASI